jgi:heme-degrading monooxygenase HmoA
MIADTPAPPYWAVIFTSLRTEDEGEGEGGYGAMAAAMERLAQRQPGFLGMESARDGVGITVSYWRDPDSIVAWKADLAHLAAQEKGRADWYARYRVRVARVERDYGFER